jgi:hypothetical protein
MAQKPCTAVLSSTSEQPHLEKQFSKRQPSKSKLRMIFFSSSFRSGFTLELGLFQCKTLFLCVGQVSDCLGNAKICRHFHLPERCAIASRQAIVIVGPIREPTGFAYVKRILSFAPTPDVAAGPGRASDVSLKEFRQGRRLQELIFDLAKSFTRDCLAQPKCTVPSHVLFPQLVQIVSRYLNEKVRVHPPADLKDLFLAPYYGWLVEILLEALRPDTSEG